MPEERSARPSLASLDARLKRVEALVRSLSPSAAANDSDEGQFARILLDPVAQITVRQILLGATLTLRSAMNGEEFSSGTPFTNAELKARIDRYWELATPVMKLLKVAGEWGNEDQNRLWAGTIERLADVDQSSGVSVWLALRRWPAVLAMYSAGLSATIAQNYVALYGVLIEPRVMESGLEIPAVVALDAPSVFDSDAAKRLEGMDRRHTPVSDYLHERFQPMFEAEVGSAQRFDSTFDDFEFFIGLVHIDESERKGWAPVGRFAWRRQRYESFDPLTRLSATLARKGAGWPPLAAGFFGGSLERAEASLNDYKAFIQNVSVRFW